MRKRSVILLGALLASLLTGCRSADNPEAVFTSILEQRHTDQTKALAMARQAHNDAAAKHFPAKWEQPFRLLYSDILVEQSKNSHDLPEVEKLLTFSPQDKEAAARQRATQAYLKLKMADYGTDSKKIDLIAAKDINEEALAMADSVPDPCWRAEVLAHYVRTLTDLQMSDDATRTIARAEREVQNCSDPYWLAAWDATKGYFYHPLFRYEQEKTVFEAALNLAESHHFPSLINASKANLAIAYMNLGDSDSALRLLAPVQSQDARLNVTDQAHSFSLQGAVHYQRGDYEAAAVDYARAVELLKGRQQPDEYYSDLEELVAAQLELNHLTEAAVNNDEVVNHAGAGDEVPRWVGQVARINAASIARMRGEPAAALQQLSSMENSLKGESDRQVIAGWHIELAQTLEALGRNKEAEREFKKAVDTANEVRSGIGDDWDRMTYSVYPSKFIAPYVDFRVDQGDVAGALQLAEAFRAKQLSEKLHSTELPAPEKFRKIASDRNAVILSYWITAKRSYVWVTNAHETRVFPLSGLDTLGRDIENHNTEVRNYRGSLNDPKSSSDLYRKLIAPAESMIPPGANVILVPDGLLAALNFETLIPPARPAKFWLDSVTVSVSPSLAVLRDAKAQPLGQQHFLLVGGTVPKDLPRLPDGEVKIVRDLFPAVSTKSLEGRDATPQRFLESEPGKFSLLHISAHAFANKESPLDSYIAFSPDGTHQDGRLFAHDLMDLKLHSYLVILSACQGASGRALPGEGQVGLTWAILSAGAQNVVASLSKVSDSATADFMRQLYKFLKAGEDPAKALHDAKLAIASKQPLPYYWGAFQIYTR